MGYSFLLSTPIAMFSQLFSLVTSLYIYVLIVYFSVGVVPLKNTSMAMLAVDARMRDVNKQLNRVLTTQALAPLVFAIAPPIFINVVGVTGVMSVGFGTQAFMSLLMSLQPVASGRLTLLMIRPYRRAILGLVCGRKQAMDNQASIILRRTTVTTAAAMSI